MTRSKQELRALADQLLICEPVAINLCVNFILTTTKGTWHGRARALMCRRLKHCTVEIEHRTELVTAILRRLVTGEFSEQFKDQLRLALHLNATATLSACRMARDSERDHVRRYAAWLLAAYCNRQ